MDYEFLNEPAFFCSLSCQFVCYVFVGAGLVYNLLQLHTAELLQWCNFVFPTAQRGRDAFSQSADGKRVKIAQPAISQLTIGYGQELFKFPSKEVMLLR